MKAFDLASNTIHYLKSGAPMEIDRNVGTGPVDALAKDVVPIGSLII